ncbi:probable RNA-binding protein 19 [Peromyscus eremicus]|uniref:probable RNA-binding protein 19 n=1 Tax=Peromyscus eremicus TaxID=42410 RepID=UPI0027DCD1C8|nr:probable RNA-binding protein 19 [Peromyscus eremicus]
MSRLIVKNLPNGMKEERFRQLFAAFGTLTDCSLKFTKDGKFRKFGFIGFKSEEEAQAALSHFNRSFIDTSRITVEFCKSFGDPTKPRAWSKHAQKPGQPKQPSQGSVPSDTKKDDKKKKVPSDLAKLKEDAEFQEFLSIHQKRTQVATWANDALDTELPRAKTKPTSDYLNFDSDSDSGQESEEELAGEEPEEEQGLQPKAATQRELSDMDYLKSKMVRAEESSADEDEEDSEDEAVNCEEGSEAEEEDGSPASPAQQESGSRGAVPGSRRPQDAAGKFHHVPLYLEWAPIGVFGAAPQKKDSQPAQTAEKAEAEPETGLDPEGEKASGEGAEAPTGKTEEEEEEEDEEEEESVPGCTLFIKNLNFSTTEETLKEVFSKVGAVKSCTVSKKQNKAGVLLSMGFGFVEYKKPEQAQKALKQLQGHVVDGHKLEVRISERATKPALTSTRKKQVSKKQTTSKILVRNIPFQANQREIRELFSTFGELKTVRLPKKMTGTGAHRGFGFVDFVTKQDAKKAFNALCHSTHLYGRRLVLEWADSEVTVQALRRKTARHFQEPPKKKRSAVLDGILEQLEDGDDDGDSEQALQL